MESISYAATNLEFSAMNIPAVPFNRVATIARIQALDRDGSGRIQKSHEDERQVSGHSFCIPG